MSKIDLDKYKFNTKDYEIVREISKGGFGIVTLVRNKTTKEAFATKTNLNNTGLSTGRNKQLISREVGILIKVKHPTIIGFQGYSHKDFKGEKNLTILMDYMKGGSISDLLELEEKGICPKNYDNTKRQILLIGISRGMMILHQLHIIHRDLKAENILLDEDLYPRISDFGLSKIFDPSHSLSQSIMDTGTAAYMAPEVIESDHFNTKADVYAFGILMNEILSGKRAYSDLLKGKKRMTGMKLKREVCNGLRPQIEPNLKKGLRRMIERCLLHNPKERPSFREIYYKLSLSKDDFYFQFEENSYEKNMIEDDEEEMNEFGQNTEDEECESLLLNKQYCLDDVDMGEILDYIDIVSNEPILNLQKNVSNSNQSKEIEDLKDQLKQLKKKIRHKDTEINDLKEEIQNMQHREEEKNKKQKKLIEKVNAIDQKVKNSDNETEIKDQIQNFETEIKNDYLKFQNEIKDYISSIQTQKEIMEEMKKKIDSLEECNRMMSDEIEMHNLFIHFGEKNKYENLLRFLMLEKRMNKNEQKLLNIIFTEGNAVFISSGIISCMHENGSFLSREMEDHLRECGEIYLDIEYQKKEFEEIYREVKEMKKRVGENVKISINYTKSEIDQRFREDKEINIIRFGSTVREIKSIDYKGSFENCLSLTKIIIPSSVTSIGNFTFGSCSSLSSITFPSSVTSIGNYAFRFCSSLSSVIIPSSVTIIGDGAFCRCSSLSSVIIPFSVTSINDNTFDNCSSLSSITIPTSITSIGCYAFSGCISLSSITIPSSVTSIGQWAFYKCKSLTSVTIPPLVTSIQDQTFYECTSLKTVTIPSSVTSIEDYVFQNCSSLSNVTIPSSVTSIGKGAFWGCSSLSSIRIPSSVKSIKSYAFVKCSSLSSVTIPSHIFLGGLGIESNVQVKKI